MKIALVIEHFDAGRGGAEAFTVWLAEKLLARGHAVHIVCHDYAAAVNRYRQATQRASHDADRSHQAHPPEERADLLKGVQIHKLRGMKLNSGIGFRAFGRKARLWCEAAKASGTIDVAHSMTVAYPGDVYQPHAGVYAAIQAQAIASRREGAEARWKRLMLNLSGKQRTLLALEKRALAPASSGGAPHILSLCPMMNEQIGQYYSTASRDAAQIVMLPNPQIKPMTALSTEQITEKRNWFRSHYGLSAEDRVALFVGHDFRRKGLAFAIETIAKTHEWKLLIVGLGKAREYVELANALGIGDANGRAARILFVGPTKEVEAVYAAGDALLLPTFYDSFGLVALEALAHGLPVVSTALLGAKYLVMEANAGLIVASPRDTDAMAQGLEKLPARKTAAEHAQALRAKEVGKGMPPSDYLARLEAIYAEVGHREHRGRTK